MIAWLLACTEPPPPPPPEPSMPATSAPRAAPAPGSRELGSLRIVATGDVLLHATVQEAASARSYDALFAATKPLVESGDVAFANLETPIAPKTGKPIVPLEFNAPPAVLDSLVQTGFDLVSFANNHVYDQGRPGFAETLDHLDASGLAYVGAGRTCEAAAAARVIEHDGVKVAFLGSSRWYNDRLNTEPGEPCADTYTPEAMIARAKAARAAGADAVVVSLHWGREYATSPTPEQIEEAHQMVEGGVDLLLGHHSHVLGPIEVLHTQDGRVAVIAYSLGNYISNQSAWYEPGLNPPSSANPRDGVILAVRVVRREYGVGANTVERVELADLSATPLWTTNNGPIRGDAPPDITVEPLLERLARMQSRMAAAGSKAEIVAAGTEIDEMERRWRQVGKILGEQFLVER